MFVAHVLEFTHSDAMLAGTGATHIERALHHAFVQRERLLHRRIIIWIKKHGGVKVAVTDVTDDRGV